MDHYDTYPFVLRAAMDRAMDEHMVRSRFNISSNRRRRIRSQDSFEDGGYLHGSSIPVSSFNLGLPNIAPRRRISSTNDDRFERLENPANILNKYANPLPLITNNKPPNWKKHVDQTFKEQLTYKTFRVSSKTAEYATIATLLEPARITSMKQVVNPTLWNNFVKRRKEMIKSKSDDVDLLTKIGSTKEEINNCLQYSRNFPKHPDVANFPFNDNMVLLFHCTSSKENIDSILTTGLDERIGRGGLLGRGIYFTDSPKKSMSYDQCDGVIFIFAVLLGDCLSMGPRSALDLVREPKKSQEQKRHHNDLFFDSIVGQPGQDNEYVIYNRHQCIPLYMIKYERGIPGYLAKNGRIGLSCPDYENSRQEFPPFCWMQSGSRIPMPNVDRLAHKTWPFYANEVFAKMETSE